MTLDELLQLTDDCKEEIAELPWHDDDVRHSFFGFYYSTIYDYYIGKSVFRLAQLIGEGNVLFKGEIYDFKAHAKRLYEIQDHPLLATGYHNDLNRNIALGTWTSFEHSISLIFEYLVTDFEYDAIIKTINAKLVKAISSLEESYIAAIFEILKKSSFVPLIRRFNFIIERNKNQYIGDLRADREFIEFVSRLRNCMVHANGYYHGNYFRYEFNETVFEFKDKAIFSQTGQNLNIYLEMCIKLKEIFKNMCACISEVENIPYPEDGQQNIV